ncbi:unnamed protein product [Somion occarium]|uniref:Uncharacterized protein n=1 Tax=Somion occarium TaxID=3059160 RepID=A0ABP1DRT3_9APHY
MNSQTILFPPPPPTTNLIEGKHRLRLMRSTRKLGAVLGTVAHVSESDPKSLPVLLPIGVQHNARPSTSSSTSSVDSVKSSRRQGSIFSVPTLMPESVYTSPSPMSSTSSLSLDNDTKSETHCTSRDSKHKLKRPAALPRPLVLRLNAVPQRLQVPSTPQTLPSTPSISATLIPPSPYGPDTPTTPISPTPSETRRKRMAKLTRTLGETIPPQLVTFARKKVSTPTLKINFSPDVTPAVVANKAGRRRSMSVDFDAGRSENMSPYPRSSRVWVTENKSWRGEWNRKDIKDVQKQLRSLKAR